MKGETLVQRAFKPVKLPVLPRPTQPLVKRY